MTRLQGFHRTQRILNDHIRILKITLENEFLKKKKIKAPSLTMCKNDKESLNPLHLLRESLGIRYDQINK